MTAIRLKIGNKFSDIEVVQDAKYPSMWRVRRADGTLTDMVNLARAKDAALAAARPRGLGGHEDFSWHRRELPLASLPVRQIMEAAE